MGDQIKEVFLREGLWERWTKWACGITSAGNGVYPWDVEDFLEGLPNRD